MVICEPLYSQVSIPARRLVKEDFNNMGTGTALPANWKVTGAGEGLTAGWSAPGNNAAVQQQAGAGSPVTPGSYNWGVNAGSDRAIGFMSGAGAPGPAAVMVHYQNNTGAVLTAVSLQFQLERYRINMANFRLLLFTSVDGSNWVAQNSGNISAGVLLPGAAGYSFSTPSTVYKSVVISGLSIAGNGSFYIKWVFISGEDNVSQGIGLDNVVLL
ncbi:MAG TPA: hypothetical protein PKE30_03830, partial [Niabella sp.]|nr:hypothetical protein [Niabella sp.]